MVIVEEGKRAVWEHCKEAGIDGDIARISKAFDQDIKDICVIHGGKMTYIHERPRKATRIAVATVPDKTLKQYLDEAKKGKK
jgi:hypothetical protein